MEKKFSLERVRGAPVATDELIADLRRAAAAAGTEILSQRLYSETGKYDPTTVARRFGSWNTATAAAGLVAANEINYSDAVLFENVMRLWEFYGRQPRRAELASPPSTVSQSPYKRRFGSWMDALQQFVSYANSEEAVALGNGQIASIRMPSLWCEPCQLPGIAPACRPRDPWSAGGQTVEDNLRTLCERCNLGKSNVL